MIFQAFKDIFYEICKFSSIGRFFFAFVLYFKLQQFLVGDDIMENIYKCDQLNLIPENTLFLLDDELGSISLALKSEDKDFKDIDFRLKKLLISDETFGVLLLKLDNKIYSCFIDLDRLQEKICLEKLIHFDFLTLIIFDNSKEQKVYKISNSLKNKIIFNISRKSKNIKKHQISLEEVKNMFSNTTLWNM